MKVIPDKNKFQTGDILLFHWKPICGDAYNCCITVFGCLIELFTKSKYTHSAMIIRDPPWRPDLKGLYILESSLEKFTDAEDQEIKFGVQLVEFDQMINDFHGDIYWRSLDCVRDERFKLNLLKAHSKVHNRPYDTIPIDYIRAGLYIHHGDEQRKNFFFCSSLVIFMYICLGLLDKNLPWTVLPPSALGTEKFVKHLEFKNCLLYDEIKIK